MVNNNNDNFGFKCHLIEEIYKYPAIYDKANPNHYKRDHRVTIFNEIGVILGCDGMNLL